MARPDDIVAYTYAADNTCPNCTLMRLLQRSGLEGHGLSYVVEEALDRLAISEGIDREDESSFDSDDFPKVVFRDMVEDGETCGECGEELG